MTIHPAPTGNLPPVLKRRKAFRTALMDWYSANFRPFSWRGATDPYKVWIAEIALQQTRTVQGTPYIERLLAAFPDVHALSSASIDQVLKLWEGLGYYSRARNLHRAARQIVELHAGRMPSTAREWLELPGIGPYTAGAIASIANGEPVPAVDGNVKRVLARLLDYPERIDTPRAEKFMRDTAAKLVRGESPGAFNQSLMELGAEICTPRNPLCGSCPVASYCLARRRGAQADRPVRKAKRQVPHKHIVVAAIRKNGRYLIGKRPAEGLLGGLWEFPGGKIEPGESHEQALMREAREELSIAIRVEDYLATVKHAYSHFTVTLHVYRCAIASGKPRAAVHTELKWVPTNRFGEFAFPKANNKFLQLL